mgnify:CR=1 FL=1
MNLENKIEAQRKRMEQEKNKLDMLMKKAKMAVSANDAFGGLQTVCNYHTDDVAGFLGNLCDE